MKGKKFYIILIGLLIIGISSVFVYRQQEEARFLKFEGYEIAEIESRVAGLYNKDKTDLAEDITKKEIEELENTLNDLQVKDLGRQNKARIESVQKEFTDATDMIDLEEDIKELFIAEDIVDKEVSGNEVEELGKDISDFEERMEYYDRNFNRLDNAKQQIEDIEVATGFVKNLFEENLVREDITREDEEKALNLISLIKNEEVKAELVIQIETVNLALTEREELEALEEALIEESEETEEEIEIEEDSENEPRRSEYTAPSNPGNIGASNSYNSGESSNWSNSNNSSNSRSPVRETETNGETDTETNSEDSGTRHSEIEGSDDTEQDVNDSAPGDPNSMGSDTDASETNKPAPSELDSRESGNDDSETDDSDTSGLEPNDLSDEDPADNN